MKHIAATALTLLLALAARGERVRWTASEAFAQAGIIESYLPADGKEWRLADGAITVSFWKNGGEYPPQMLLNADNGGELTAGMFVSGGNTLEVLADIGLEIERVRVSSTSFYPAPAVDVTPLPADEYVMTLPADGRMVVTLIDITYGEAGAIKETEADASAAPGLLYDLQGRRLAAPPRRGLYVADGKLRFN